MATRRQFVAGKGDAPCRFSSVYGSQGLRLGLRLKGTSGQRRLGAVPTRRAFGRVLAGVREGEENLLQHLRSGHPGHNPVHPHRHHVHDSHNVGV